MDKKEFKKLLNNLPKNPGVMDRDRFFNSAVLVPFIKIEGKYFLLFQKRAKGITQAGDICFPGGRFEEGIDKNFKQTALRETQEELGISKKNIKIIGQLDTMVTSFGAVVESFIGIIKKKDLKDMQLDKKEVEKTFLIPLDFLKKEEVKVYNLRSEVKPYNIDKNGEKEIYFPVKKLGLPKTYRKPWGHKKHKVYVYKYKNIVIWGMTAVIVNDLLKKY